MNPVQSRQPWSISEVRTVDGEYMVVGGEGHGFGLIASCPELEIAQAIVAAADRIEELEAALRELFDQPTENPLRMTVEQRERLWAAHAKARAALQRTEP